MSYSPVTLPKGFPYLHTSHRQPDTEITHLHCHDCLELGCCHRGAGIFVVEDKVMPYRAGDATVISDREMHLAQSMAGSTSDWSFMYVRPSQLLPQATAVIQTAQLCGPSFINVISPSDQPDLTVLIGQLAAQKNQTKLYGRELSSGLLLAILALCHRLPGQSSRADDDQGRRDRLAQVAPALQMMGAHLDEELSLDDLATVCAISVSHFRRCFRAAMGESPKRYLIRMRLRMAMAQLTDPSRSIIDIALSCGFGSLSSFNRHFRSLLGQAPRDWRKSMA